MALSEPYIISITVYDTTNVAQADVTVSCYSENTGETITSQSVTNASGQALIDLSNFPSGYTNDTYYRFTASGTGSIGKNLRYKVVNKQDFIQVEKVDFKYEV